MNFTSLTNIDKISLLTHFIYAYIIFTSIICRYDKVICYTVKFHDRFSFLSFKSDKSH